MSVRVRPATLQDGVAVLALLEDVGYYPEPDPVRADVPQDPDRSAFPGPGRRGGDGKIVGLATLSMRCQLGLGGLLACLDEFAIAPGSPNRVDKLLLQATIGKARGLGARKVVVNKAEREHASPARAPARATTRVAARFVPARGA